MRFRISTILCLTLFALTHSAPSKRVDGDSAKKDDQAPALDQPQDAVAPPLEQGQGQDAFDYLPQDAPPVDDMQNDCCAPGPQCMNPCQAPAAPPQAYNINFAPPAPPMPPPPPPPVYTGSNCCPPSPTCANPCPPQAAQIPPALPPPPPMLPPMQPPMQMAPPPMMPAPYGAPMGAPCCDPSVVQQCANPCGAAAPPAGDEGEERQTYQPYPG